MGDTVFINNRSAVHAGSMGQTTAFPDVNLCPPAPPAGPVPLPLPNLALDADLQGGCSSVVIEGNPMGKRSSFLGKSTGNEVAQSTGGGVVTHVVQGKAYFTSYSLDVVVEGEEAPRHLDMLTHNHAAPSPPNAAVGTNLAIMDVTVLPPLDEEQADRTDPDLEFFLDRVGSQPPADIDALVLQSSDGEYDKSLPAQAAALKGSLYVMKFEKVPEAKVYSLYWEVGGERLTIFENLPFARIAAHTAGAEEQYSAAEDAGEDEADGAGADDAGATAAQDDGGGDESAPDVDEGEEDDHATPGEHERWHQESVLPPDDYEIATLDHPADWYDPDPWSRA